MEGAMVSGGVEHESVVLHPFPLNVLQSYGGGSAELLSPEVQHQIRQGASSAPVY